MTLLILALLTAPVAVQAEQRTVYKWVDKDGVMHFGDSIPAEYAELPKEIINDHGVTIANLEGKKTKAQLEAEKKERERLAAIELQRRADKALLATYLSVDEILMHRDRRVELFQAQSRVTELYLRNLERRMARLRVLASQYQPYNEDPNAPMIDGQLAEDLRLTKDIIGRHKRNLKKFRADEQQIIARFDGDISRFKALKGLE